MRLKAAEPGSLRSVLEPSWRIAKEGLPVLAAAIAILIGVDHLTGDEAASERIHPQQEPYVLEALPSETQLRIMVRHGDEEVTVTYERRGSDYVPLAPTEDLGLPP
jgi:hypothetical protein